MRLFLYTYGSVDNFQTSENLGIFGARAESRDGSATKVSDLRRGDVIILRTTENDDGKVKILGCCRVVGDVWDQRGQSPFREQVWRDEVRAGWDPLYPLRVAVDFKIPQPTRTIFEWREWAALGVKNARLKLMAHGSAWGAFFKGNFIEDHDSIAAVTRLLGIPQLIASPSAS